MAPLPSHQEGRNGSARRPHGVQTGEGLDDSQGHDVVSLPWLHATRYGYVGDAKLCSVLWIVFESLRDILASQLEALVTRLSNTIQSEFKCIHFNVNIGFNNTF